MTGIFENFFILLVVLAGFTTFMFFGLFCVSTAWRFIRPRLKRGRA